MIIKQNREPAFDALRVYLLFLGFVFHSLLSYIDTPINELWPYKDKSHIILFDGIAVLIHSFRMPTFFLISGYFTDKMFQNQNSFIVFKKRIFRLGIPFIIAMITCIPIVNIGFSLSNDVNSVFFIDFIYPKLESSYSRVNSSYLWFLYYLIIFSLIHLNIIKTKITLFFKHISVLLIIISMIIILMFILFFDQQNELNGSYNFVPKLTSLLGFLLFYISGIVFSRNNEFLTTIAKNSIIITFIGTMMFSIYVYLVYKNPIYEVNTNGTNFIIQFIYSFLSVTLTFSTLGLFVRFYKKSFPWIKYFSDSSYFLYLIHLPIIILTVAFLSDCLFSCGVKFIIVLTVSISVSLILNYIRIRTIKLFKND
jgi:glucan biosynthesis protein C